MKINLAQSSLILLCVAMAGAIGGGLYEQIVLTSLWSRSPPSSFSIIQPGTGVPLQNFWIPVHAAITIFILLSLFLTWRQIKVRFRLLGSYIEVEISQRTDTVLSSTRVNRQVHGLVVSGSEASARRTVNVLPWPSSLSAVMEPFCCSRIFLVSARPRPVPC